LRKEQKSMDESSSALISADERSHLGREAEPASPARVNIYAVDTVSHAVRRSTRNAFIYSEPLTEPHADTYYVWDGELHPVKDEVAGPAEHDRIKASNHHRDLATLAINFAENYRSHPNQRPQSAGQPSYELVFDPTPTAIEDDGSEAVGSHGTRKPRSLTPQEQETFLLAFQEANRRAA
jgi:hypothetical protein